MCTPVVRISLCLHAAAVHAAVHASGRNNGHVTALHVSLQSAYGHAWHEAGALTSPQKSLPALSVWMAVAGLAVTPKGASRLMLERLAGIAGLTNIPAAT